jgi:transposase
VDSVLQAWFNPGMPAKKQYQIWNPSQSFLLPPSPMEWLPEGHVVYFVLDIVEQLDLSAIEGAIQDKDHRGTHPYAPQMMVALLLYGYCVGVYSSRRIERATYEDVGFRVLSGGQHPHFTTINEFRRLHLPALGGLFLQVLKLCSKAGLVKLGHVAVDGTKVQGNASMHKAMSYKRMKEKEKQLKAEIEQMLQRAQQADADEDEKYGPGNQVEDLPQELRRRETRLEKIRQAKQALEEEAQQARARQLRQQGQRAEHRSKTHADPVERRRAATMAKNRRNMAGEIDGRKDSDDDVDPPTTGDGLNKHEPKTKQDGSPDDKAQMNFTDAESRIMESGGRFLQGYNCQAAVDDENQVIVAQAVSNKCPDNDNLIPMLEQVKNNCGRAAEKVTADAGYWKPGVEAQGTLVGTDVYVSTSREKKDGTETGDSAIEEHVQDDRARMRKKLRDEDGRNLYKRRKAVVEPVFGQAKEARGLRRFLLRGLKAVGVEWSLVCTGHNLLKLHRALVAVRGS